MELTTANILLSLAIAISTTLILLLSKLWWNNRKFYKLASNFESPPGYSYYPLIGHAHNLKSHEDIINVALSFTSKFGVLYLGPTLVYYLNDVDLLENCLTNDKCLNRPNYLDSVDVVQGSLFLAKDHVWKNRRKLLSAGFNQRILNFYTGKFTKHDMIFSQKLEQKVGQVFNIYELSEEISFQKFFECAFGLENDTRCKDFMEAFKTIVTKQTSDIFSILKYFKFLTKDTIVDDCNITLRRIANDILTEKMKKLEDRSKEGPIDEEYEELLFIDLILQLIDNGKYDARNLLPEITSFIFGGVDTCANSFSYLCLCLALHLEIQKKVYEEIVQVTGDRPFHYSDYPRFIYLQMVIKETMRLFPIGANVHRQANDEVKIGEYVFPKNSVLFLNILSIHRSSKHYPNPLKFDPGRFAPDSEAVKNRHRFAYLPFSGGRRNCIGERFAMLALVSTVVTIFKKFRFETTFKSIEDIRMGVTFSAIAIDGYLVRIYPRY